MVAFTHGNSKGTVGGHISKDVIGYGELMYNRINFRDLNKRKSETRRENESRGINVLTLLKEEDAYVKYSMEKAKRFIKERESFNNFLESGYIDTFRHLYPDEVKFSYFSARRVNNKAENKGWRLDYFVINEESKDNLVDSTILNEYFGSDHTPIKLVYKA